MMGNRNTRRRKKAGRIELGNTGWKKPTFDKLSEGGKRSYFEDARKLLNATGKIAPYVNDRTIIIGLDASGRIAANTFREALKIQTGKVPKGVKFIDVGLSDRVVEKSRVGRISRPLMESPNRKEIVDKMIDRLKLPKGSNIILVDQVIASGKSLELVRERLKEKGFTTKTLVLGNMAAMEGAIKKRGRADYNAGFDGINLLMRYGESPVRYKSRTGLTLADGTRILKENQREIRRSAAVEKVENMREKIRYWKVKNYLIEAMRRIGGKGKRR